MSNVLKKICEEKRSHLVNKRRERPFSAVVSDARLADPPRGFAAALRASLDSGKYGLIAEIKKASPSKGLIRDDFNPPSLALAYAAGGASCVSVLTDTPYFQGDDKHLVAARTAIDLPVLRKDFMLDAYQIAESRSLGADCILLIMAALEDTLAHEMAESALEWGMDVLVEVHDKNELERALRLPTELIGVNNRNLKTLEVDISMTEVLADVVPEDRILISESGLYTPADLSRMASSGANCFLVGESLMRQTDVENATRLLLAREIDET